jgi:hypothetical protein
VITESAISGIITGYLDPEKMELTVDSIKINIKIDLMESPVLN